MKQLFRNPALLMTCLLPLTAVIASFLTLAIALIRPEGELPEQYHWEGFQLDRDFSRAARASELAVKARLSGFDGSGSCQLELEMDGELPSALTLTMAHATRPALDQKVLLRREERPVTSRVYVGRCHGAAPGSWRLELTDESNGWALRRSVRGSLGRITLVANGQAESRP